MQSGLQMYKHGLKKINIEISNLSDLSINVNIKNFVLDIKWIYLPTGAS